MTNPVNDLFEWPELTAEQAAFMSNQKLPIPTPPYWQHNYGLGGDFVQLFDVMRGNWQKEWLRSAIQYYGNVEISKFDEYELIDHKNSFMSDRWKEAALVFDNSSKQIRTEMYFNRMNHSDLWVEIKYYLRKCSGIDALIFVEHEKPSPGYIPQMTVVLDEINQIEKYMTPDEFANPFRIQGMWPFDYSDDAYAVMKYLLTD